MQKKKNTSLITNSITMKYLHNFHASHSYLLNNAVVRTRAIGFLKSWVFFLTLLRCAILTACDKMTKDICRVGDLKGLCGNAEQMLKKFIFIFWFIRLPFSAQIIINIMFFIFDIILKLKFIQKKNFFFSMIWRIWCWKEITRNLYRVCIFSTSNDAIWSLSSL